MFLAQWAEHPPTICRVTCQIMCVSGGDEQYGRSPSEDATGFSTGGQRKRWSDGS